MLALAYVLLIQSILFTVTGQAMISGITAVETKHPLGKIPLLMYSRHCALYMLPYNTAGCNVNLQNFSKEQHSNDS